MFQDGFFLTDVKKESRKEKTIFLKTNENFFGLLHGHEVRRNVVPWQYMQWTGKIFPTLLNAFATTERFRIQCSTTHKNVSNVSTVLRAALLFTIILTFIALLIRLIRTNYEVLSLSLYMGPYLFKIGLLSTCSAT